ncbi:unnamed protein product [Medioppia subpectinata]|uniref:Cyclic AMP-dependent transcription factor ATF-2 n=1 Tax=Medioppia subpectinata TaxID=1979941 RepID=A0A7R9KJL0_9ACAR|nr:unnamed protein product [Medioppia subpectinata]CAG2103517.1 unnamed protein product [Medioppia subpectinata]
MNDTNDKPFVCTERACLMKFSTVDRLAVHQKQHTMKLKLSSMSSQLSIADQTPTPSRILGNFLQNWEASGLNSEIQEITNLTPILNDSNHTSKTAADDNKDNTNTCNSKSSSADNPFAQSFQNALKNTNHLKIPEITTRITASSTSDSPLNTPSIFPNEGLMAIVNAALNTPDHDFHFNTTIDRVDATLGQTVETTQSVTALVSEVTTTNSSAENRPKGETLKNALKGQRFQAVPVIRTANTSAVNNNMTISSTVPNIVISQSNHKLMKTLNTTKLRTLPIAQTAQMPKNTAIIAPKMKETSLTIGNSSNSLYKVILKLPDGRSVQLPLIQTPITQTALQPTSASHKLNDLLAVTSAESLTIGAITSSSSHGNETSLSSLQSKVDATLASLPPKAKPGRKSKFAPEEDPKEKKARSLERNRAAAMRCRLKRKHWIDSLEEKADEYEKINEKLQSEVVALRREVTLLKTALLAHKDCPVTQQQQQQQKVTNEVTQLTIVTTNGNIHRLDNNINTNGLT